MKLIVSNNQIFHPMIRAAEIALTLQKNGRVTIDLNGEAPSLQETQLVELFDYLESQGLDISKIQVLTGNPLETYNHVSTKFIPTAFYEFQWMQRFKDKIPTHKNIKYHFHPYRLKVNMLFYTFP